MSGTWVKKTILIRFTLQLLRLLRGWRCRSVFLYMDCLDMVLNSPETEPWIKWGLLILPQEQARHGIERHSPWVSKRPHTFFKRGFASPCRCIITNNSNRSQYSELGWEFELILRLTRLLRVWLAWIVKNTSS